MLPRFIGSSGDLLLPFDTLGQGAFGRAFGARRCNPSQTGELVCVKEFANPTDEEFEKIDILVRRTAQFTGIANIYETANCAESGKRNSIVMRYCPGPNLRDQFEDRLFNPSLTERLRLCRSLCETVAQFTTTAGQSPIIFSDLAPQNICINPDGRGLTAFDTDSCWVFNTRNLAGQVKTYRGAIGTPGHIAAELIINPSMTPSAQSMKWSLAVVLFQLITNHHPCTPKVSTSTQGIDEHKQVELGIYPHYLPASSGFPAPKYPFEIPSALNELSRMAFTGPVSLRPGPEAFIEAIDQVSNRRKRPRLVGIAASVALALSVGAFQLLRPEWSAEPVPPSPVANTAPMPIPTPPKEALTTQPQPQPEPKSLFNPAIRSVIK